MIALDEVAGRGDVVEPNPQGRQYGRLGKSAGGSDELDPPSDAEGLRATELKLDEPVGCDRIEMRPTGAAYTAIGPRITARTASASTAAWVRKSLIVILRERPVTRLRSSYLALANAVIRYEGSWPRDTYIQRGRARRKS